MPNDSTSQTTASREPKSRGGAAMVAMGIFLSRIMGFVRERAVAYFFGVGAHSDVFATAFRGPNLLQNLLGEGTISAAFVPIYSRMLAEGREKDAGRFAGAMLGLLAAGVAVLVGLGVLFAEPLVSVLAPGFRDDEALLATGEIPIDRFTLAVAAVRLIFPMTGLLVLSAWALGVLNSHRRFFVSYVAPVIWNLAIIAGLFVGAEMVLEAAFDASLVAAAGPGAKSDLVLAGCAGALVGGLLQLLVQLPLVFREMRGFRLSLSTAVEGVKEALSNFGPVVAGRGVYQLWTYLSLVLASLLSPGAVGALRFSSQLYMLPISLFGMSVAASELPELSRLGSEELERFWQRLRRSIRQMSFLTIPTLVGYLVFGFLLVGALFRTGEFSVADNLHVWLILGSFSLGLLATTISRLFQNAFYALDDTRTPAKIAVVRVVVSAAVALPVMFWLDRISLAELGFTRFAGEAGRADDLFLGAVGLGIGAACGAWAELAALKLALSRRIEGFHLPWGPIFKMIGVAWLSTLPAVGVWWLLPGMHVALTAVIVTGVYAATYLGLAHLLGISELDAWLGRFLGRFRKSR